MILEDIENIQKSLFKEPIYTPPILYIGSRIAYLFKYKQGCTLIKKVRPTKIKSKKQTKSKKYIKGEVIPILGKSVIPEAIGVLDGNHLIEISPLEESPTFKKKKEELLRFKR